MPFCVNLVEVAQKAADNFVSVHAYAKRFHQRLVAIVERIRTEGLIEATSFTIDVISDM
jgi:hypothetical protein